jgi:hypothetical protein
MRVAGAGCVEQEQSRRLGTNGEEDNASVRRAHRTSRLTDECYRARAHDCRSLVDVHVVTSEE